MPRKEKNRNGENPTHAGSPAANAEKVLPVSFIRGADGITVAASTNGAKVAFGQLIEQAQPGERIFLEKGNYNLAQSIQLDKPLQFLAKDPGKVTFVGSQLGILFFYHGSGQLILNGIHFKCIGAQPNFGIGIHSGELIMENCSVEGDPSDRPSCGLVISGAAEAVISGSSFSGFKEGISVLDQASATLVQNKVFENNTGINFDSTSAGKIEKCQCYQNASEGILIQGQGKTALIENLCHDNKRVGIFCVNASVTRIAKNHCKNNRGGIVLSDQAQSVIEENECSENSDGIVLQEDAKAAISRNVVHHNHDVGIFIGFQTAASVEQNQVHDNLRGIIIVEKASAAIKGNKIFNNVAHAIVDISSNKSQLEDNDCYDNNSMGAEEIIVVPETETNYLAPMEFYDWQEKYCPIADDCGICFDSGREALDVLKAKTGREDPNCCWTRVHSDDGGTELIIPGFHLVNRLDYLVTEIPREDNEWFEVYWEEQEEYIESRHEPEEDGTNP